MEPNYYRGVWYCEYGHDRVTNRGDARFCGGCGKGRPEDVQFHLLTGAEVVNTLPEDMARATAGENWSCSRCDGSNSALNKFCDACGMVNGAAADEIQTAGKVVRPRRSMFVPSPPKPNLPLRNAVPHRVPEFGGSPSRFHGGSGDNKKWIAIGLIVLLFVSWGLYMLLRTHEEEVNVTNSLWSREVEIQKEVTKTDEGWDYPSAARVTRNYRKLYKSAVLPSTRTESKKVGSHEEVCGKIDLQNGYFKDKICDVDDYKDFTKSVPGEPAVYKTWYEYEYDEWVSDDSKTSSGNYQQTPYWPVFTLGGKQREASRHEHYWVELSNGRRYNTDLQRWQTFRPGQNYTAKVNGMGMVLDLVQ